jgi:hypothetical protein
VHGSAGFVALPQLFDAIQIKYDQLGGPSGFLKQPVSRELATSAGGGLYEMFQGGEIVYSAATGAHVFYGPVENEFGATAGEMDFNGQTVQANLGLPIADEAIVTGLNGATVTRFQNGEIDYSPSTGAHVVCGAIDAKYNALGGANAIGFPIADETYISSTSYKGGYESFQRLLPITIGATTIDLPVGRVTSIDWTPASGATYSSAGTSANDITQGSAGTCWIDASIAALEASGQDLSLRIHYVGRNWYSVNLFNYADLNNHSSSSMVALTERVYFDGTTYGADLGFNPQTPSQSWALIMQRAVIQAIHTWDPSQTIQNPHSGGPLDALATLTGRSVQYVGIGDPNFKSDLLAAVAAKKSVVFGTKGTGAVTLVSDHAYAVLSAGSRYVTLYNPWGAAQTVAWSVLAQDGDGISFC